jgi:autotransporter-associated beta strand protein
MKTRLILSILALCGAFATTAAFGQQLVFTWTNNPPGDLGTTNCWNPNGTPNPGGFAQGSGYVGDMMQFDGQSSGPVSATSNGGAQQGGSVGGTTAGLYVHLTSNQVNRVTFYTTVVGSASTGIRFNSMVFDAGSGGFTMGTGSTTNCLDTLWGTANPSTQGLTNNSANPAIINKDVRWRLGAGGAHTFVFSGTGDWYVTNDIANVNGAATVIQKDGPGTMYWTAGNNSFWGTETVIASPMAISGGTLMLLSSGLFPPNTTINMSSNAAPALLEFNVVGGSQTIANPINGNGNVQVNNGTLTLSGANTYTGNTILSGGKLVANRAENPGVNGPLGNGGTISFSGGTLAYTVLNNADYSGRFSTNDNQAYRIDTSGDGSANNVTFSNALTSKGGTLTKLGSGTLTLVGTNTYSGLTTISAGELLFQGPMSGSTNIIVADGATLGVFGNGAQQLTLATLTMGSVSGANLEFDNVSSLTTTPLVVGTISATGPITINIGSGSFDTIGQVFPLFSWGSGSAPTIVLGTVNGANGTLVTNGNTLALKVTATAYVYTGLNGGVWDLATPNNWKQSGSAVLFANGAPALIDDSAATGTPYVSLYANVSPSVFTVNNNVINYTIFASLGFGITGGTGFTKSGNAPLAIYGPNAYTGVTTLNGGVTSVDTLDNGGAPTSIGAATKSAANLVLNGGTLQYIGNGASIDRSFTLGPSGGAIDSSGYAALNLTSAGAVGLNGAGSHTLILTGIDTNKYDLFALSLTDSVAGATALTKAGSGTWVLTGTNKYSGITAIQGGTLQFGNGGASGAIGSGNVTDNGRLIFNRTGSNVISGVVSGTGSVRVGGGGTVVLPGNNSYSGGTTISNGSTLQVGNRGTTGSLSGTAAIRDDGLLIFNTTGTFNLTAGGINGTGNLIVRGGGLLASISGNTFTGWTVIDPGSTFMPCQGHTGSLFSSVVTNNGTLQLVREDNGVFIYSNTVTGSGRVWVDANNNNAGDMTLAGACNYTGGTFIGDNGLIVDNGSGIGWITGNVTFTNSSQVANDNPRTLTFTRPDNVIFPGNIVTNFRSAQVNLGIVVQNGTGTLTLTGTNTYGSGTTITNGGTLQVGNGGTSGSIGSGPVTDNGVLIFNRADDVTLARAITGTGSLIKTGAGKLTLSNTNDTYTGDTTVSNGTLVTAIVSGNLNVNGGTVVTTNVVGNVNVNSGTFATAAGSSVGALTAFNNLNISGGTVQVSLDKTRSDITSYLFVITAVNYTNGTLKLINVGPALTVGDTFQISYLPVVRGNAMPIVSPGFTVTNHLGDDGTVVVTGVTASVAKVTTTVSGGQLTLSWPSAWTGLNLQVQTNTLAKGLGTNWVTIPGYDTVNGYTNTIDKTSGSVFYRLAP